MENSNPEFSNYLKVLSSILDMDESIHASICLEVEQHLYAKYHEYLVKGYGLTQSTSYTLKTFEDPKKLARTFNKVYREKKTC